jgi:hypothetical protein
MTNSTITPEMLKRLEKLYINAAKGAQGHPGEYDTKNEPRPNLTKGKAKEIEEALIPEHKGAGFVGGADDIPDEIKKRLEQANSAAGGSIGGKRPPKKKPATEKQKNNRYAVFFKENAPKVRQQLAGQYEGQELTKAVMRKVGELWKSLSD